MTAERLWGAGLVLLSGGYLWMASQVRTFWSGDPLGPRAFPTVLGIALGVSGLTLLLTSPRRKTAVSFRLSTPLVLWMVLIVYCLLLPRIGYPLATMLFLIVAAYQAGERSPVWLLCVSAVVASGLFLLFTRLLNIHLPAGVAWFLG